MKIIFQSKNKYVLRYDKGEELVEGLSNFCQTQNIEAGFFFGIGSAQEIIIAFYDVDTKEYREEVIKETVEIVNLFGNIAKMEGKIIIHAHGSFSDPKMQIRAGHVKKLVIAATGEIILEALDGKIEREYSPDIGLNLMR